jgi:hypothetical protein
MPLAVHIDEFESCQTHSKRKKQRAAAKTALKSAAFQNRSSFEIGPWTLNGFVLLENCLISRLANWGGEFRAKNIGGHGI